MACEENLDIVKICLEYEITDKQLLVLSSITSAVLLDPVSVRSVGVFLPVPYG